MGTEILKSFSHLQNELDEAKISLKGVDENIKRLIGRDPSELSSSSSSSVRAGGQKRPTDEKNVRQQFSNNKFGRFDNNNENNSKRRNSSSSSSNNVSVFKRLSEKISDDFMDVPPSRGLISKVIAAPKEVPSRQEVLDKQNKDEKFKDRNRRIFGSLLGTLQKFRQEETKLKKKEEKRTLIEKKIEEHEQQEKEEIKKERQELFINRKRKQQEIKMIELKMLRMKEYAVWEQMQKPRTNFIATKAKPHIHYLPRRLNDKSKILLEESKKTIEEHIEKRKQAVSEELAHIEERMTRNFEPKNNHVELLKVEKSVDRHDRHNDDDGGGSESELDLDDDVEMKEISPSPERTSAELIIVKNQHEEPKEKTTHTNKEELQEEENEQPEEEETDLVQQRGDTGDHLNDGNIEHLNNTEKLENGDKDVDNAVSVINENNSMNTSSELLQKQTEENI